jgi:hypothetical protein
MSMLGFSPAKGALKATLDADDANAEMMVASMARTEADLGTQKCLSFVNHVRRANSK